MPQRRLDASAAAWTPAQAAQGRDSRGLAFAGSYGPVRGNEPLRWPSSKVSACTLGKPWNLLASSPKFHLISHFAPFYMGVRHTNRRYILAIRLNREMRSEICDALMLHRFEQPLRDLFAKRAELADKLHRDVYKRQLSKMDELPEGWLPTYSGIKVQAGADVYFFNFNGVWSVRSGPGTVIYAVEVASDQRRCPAMDSSYDVKKVYDAGSAMADEITDIVRETQQMEQSISEAQKQVGVTLDQFVTVEKLVEAWPEVTPFIPEKQRPVSLPALPTQQLNDMLGLPT